MEKRITVTVVGGVVQDIFDIPPGCAVVVQDYDCDQFDNGDNVQDAAGDWYCESVWWNSYSAQGEPADA